MDQHRGHADRRDSGRIRFRTDEAAHLRGNERKTTRSHTVLLVALGGAALFLRNRNSASWSNSATASSEKILSFPLNDVSRLTIKTGDAELNLVKKEGSWRVTERADYPADFEKVAGLLRKLWELHAAQDVKAGPSQLGHLQLVEPGKDPNSGTSINLKDESSKVLASFLLGKKLTQDSKQGFSEPLVLPRSLCHDAGSPWPCVSRFGRTR